MSAPSQIRGPRWVLAEYDGGEWPVRLVGMARWEAWAAYQGRDLPDAAVIRCTPVEARAVLAHPMAEGMHRDESMTVTRFARLAETSRAFARQFVETETAKGSGPLARAARERLCNVATVSDLHTSARCPAGTADLLADALAAVLGPNAAVFRERPRAWPAIRAAAREIVEETRNVG